MSESPSTPFSREEERELHRRLAERDPVASAELALAYLDRLVDWLQSQNPRIDDHFCAEAADKAVLTLIGKPESYQPSKRRLEPYLRMSAQADLRNLLRKEGRHHRQRKSWKVVELDDEHGKYVGVEDPPPRDQSDSQAVDGQALTALANDEVERQVLDLMRSGERRTTEFAKVCNVTHLPRAEQARAVKLVKDRLKTRANRARKP